MQSNGAAQATRPLAGKNEFPARTHDKMTFRLPRPNDSTQQWLEPNAPQDPYAGLPKFARFATHVWGINPVGKSERELAEAGLSAMEAWMRELGVAMNLAELDVTEADLDDVVAATFIMTGGYKTLTKEDVRNVLLQRL